MDGIPRTFPFTPTQLAILQLDQVDDQASDNYIVSPRIVSVVRNLAEEISMGCYESHGVDSLV